MLEGERCADFLGAVLKAIACTPNSNGEASASEYHESVIEPASRIRALALRSEDMKLDEGEVEEVLRLLYGILSAKRVPVDERDDRMREALDRGRLSPDARWLRTERA